MLILVLVAVAVATVPLGGGRIGALADLRLRHPGVLAAALATQIAIINVVAEGGGAAHKFLHVASYGGALWFVVVNRRVPGIALLGVGTVANLLPIAANGGVMPASPTALRLAGLPAQTDGFLNSTSVADARMAMLGDIFAVPAWLPLANVFSIGDVVLVVGAFLLVHRAAGSRLAPAAPSEQREVLANRGFRRLWFAQGTSDLGDWLYTIAVVSLLLDRGAGVHVVAVLLVAQAGPAALAGLLGGPLLDRLSRVRVMISADVARAAAVLSLAVPGEPQVAHVYAVAVVLGLFSGVAQPAASALLPDIVERRHLAAANSMTTTTFNAAVVFGPVLAGLLVDSVGVRFAVLSNALTFVVSAVVLAKLRTTPFAVGGAPASYATFARELRLGLTHARHDRLVRGVFVVMALVMAAAAAKGSIEGVFVRDVLGGTATTLGGVTGAWGLGMIAGSLLAPLALARVTHERALLWSVTLVGVGVMTGAATSSVASLAACWFVAGGANGVGSVTFETLLQDRTADDVRGRVLGVANAVLDVSYLAGAGAVALLVVQGDGRVTLMACGLLFLTGAAAARLLLVRNLAPVGEQLEPRDLQALLAPYGPVARPL